MMKLSITICCLFLLLSCKTTENPEIKSVTISSDELKETVSFLASDNLKGRDTDTEGIEEAAKFIEKKLESYGVQPYFKTFKDDFEFEMRTQDTTASESPKIKSGYNVIGYLEGTDETLKNEFIVLGAHYDHIGFGKLVEGDSIANGANDNAAGTSAVVALARYFSERKNNKRSLLFCLFSAEEQGLQGSKHLAEKLKQQDMNLYTMVNFEMIGVPMNDKNYKAYITGFEESNMAKKINEYAGSELVGFLPMAKEYRLFMRSDNYPFFEQFNVPCQTISTFDFTNYEYYHHVDDEAELIDYDFMAQLVNEVAPTIEKMSNTSAKEIQLNDK